MAERRTFLGIALVAAFAVALVGTFLLWQISDRVADLESTGGSPREEPAPPDLPPPAQGSARSLATEFDKTTQRLTTTLDGVRSTLENARLDQVAPALAQLQQNTELFPATLVSLNQLVAQTSALPSLGGGLAQLNGQLGGLRGTLPGLTGQLGGTERQLGLATGTLGDLRGAITTTNEGLDRIRLVLESTVRSLDATRSSIDRTNECLARPVVCESPAAERRASRTRSP